MPSRDVELIDEARRRYQSIAMRVEYIVHDRPEVQNAAKELVRSELVLKRVCRFLLIADVARGPKSAPTTVRGCSDPDWASCFRSRLSTHLVRSSSTTHHVVALSSGESEYYGLAETCGRMRFCPHTLCTGVHGPTAARRTASRRGVCKIRHLHVQVLWVQTAVQVKRITILKVLGTETPSGSAQADGQ